ncbi:MAG: antibiotic biosynthesis monooxygenase [Bradyrhizobium sp.]|uniref:antibiotic biosynthesis monooxygenase family protein n=1 Tax=Bradyrhizobium sp. TaxID=376 RepID=UPI0025BC8126|nr:antibiotic biosynthesis monooxygenase [Bradyrhizobium sp.]MBI5264090.1 antibiotic biosynthesis monooxygenase [Bradyrhizobium sp.]
MFSVIFEFRPKAEKKDEYLGLAHRLRPILQTMDGFVDNERFESALRPGWLLSHSSWRDEKSLVRWRTNAEHCAVQARGRSEIFDDYHLRVGEQIADSDPPPHAAIGQSRFDETEIGSAKIVTFTEVAPIEASALTADRLPAELGLDLNQGALAGYDIWASIYHEGNLAVLVGWKDAKSAEAFAPRKTDAIDKLRHRKVRILRDYGRFDRREAPQFYPDITDARAAPP